VSCLFAVDALLPVDGLRTDRGGNIIPSRFSQPSCGLRSGIGVKA
jgi:hypothetical protein